MCDVLGLVILADLSWLCLYVYDILSESLFLLQICQKYEVTYATAYIMEKTEDIEGAFGVLFQVICLSVVLIKLFIF